MFYLHLYIPHIKSIWTRGCCRWGDTWVWRLTMMGRIPRARLRHRPPPLPPPAGRGPGRSASSTWPPSWPQIPKRSHPGPATVWTDTWWPNTTNRPANLNRVCLESEQHIISTDLFIFNLNKYSQPNILNIYFRYKYNSTKSDKTSAMILKTLSSILQNSYRKEVKLYMFH